MATNSRSFEELTEDYATRACLSLNLPERGIAFVRIRGYIEDAVKESCPPAPVSQPMPARTDRTYKEQEARIEFEPFCGCLIASVDEEYIGPVITDDEKEFIRVWLATALSDIDKRVALAVTTALAEKADAILASAGCNCANDFIKNAPPHSDRCKVSIAAEFAQIIKGESK